MSDQDGDSSDSVEYEFTTENDPNTVYQVKKNRILTNGESVVAQMVLDDDDMEPHIEIQEQPQPRGFRFRYECEGPSHGGLQGEKSEKYRKTYPAIRIKNYSGPARVVVTLVTDEIIPRPHAHKLVGRNCNEGTCIVELKGGQNSLTFPNLCVQHVTRRKASEVIEQRILESIKLDKLVKLGDLNAHAELTMEDIKQARTQSEKLAKEMQLNVVKLCFQAYLRDENGQFSRLLPSVLSNPIYDSKSPGANALKICRMDKYGGCCTGNEEVFLLCEKVQKDDIAVRFVEQDEDGNVTWEAYGSFGPFDVHRQYAIVFKTPPYRDTTIDRAVNVLIMLQRKSDSESSDPKSFTYYPQNMDMDDIRKKRKKTLPIYPGGGNFGSGGGSKPHNNNSFFGTVNGSSVSGSQGNLPTTVNQDEEAPMQRNFKKGLRRNPVIQRASLFADIETDGESAGHQCRSPNQALRDFYSQSTLPQGIPNPSPINTNRVTPQITHMISQQNTSMMTPQTTHMVTPQTTRMVTPQTTHMVAPQTQIVRPQNTLMVGPQTTHMVMPQNTHMVTHTHMSVPQTTRLVMPPATCTQATRMAQQFPLVFPHAQYHGQILMTPTNTYKAPMDPSFLTRGAGREENHMASIPLTVMESMDMGVKHAPLIPLTVNGHDEVDGPVMTESEEGSRHRLIQDRRVHKYFSDPSGYTAVHASVQTDADNALKMAERTARALQLYAATGDIRQLLTVQRYLTCIPDENGDIPLHTCIINHQLEVVHNLLDVMETLPNAQSKINVHNRRLQTPLHLAVIVGQAGVVDALLKAGAEPTVLDRHGNTAAHLAVLHKADECLAALLKYIRPRVSRQRPFPELDIKNIDGLSPVHIAAQKENLTAMKLLVKGKADVNMEDGKSGRTALHYAASNDDLSTAGWLLLEAKAAVNASCFDGNTALHVACGRQNIGMVALLMAAGADPKIENNDYEDDDENEEEKDKDEMDTTDEHVHGRTAEAFAMDNNKILKVLYGRPYTSMSEIHEEADNREYEQTAEMFTSLSLVSGERDESGLSSIGPITDGGDMADISYPQRVKLSQLLDPVLEGSDWRALAERLGFSKIISHSQSGHSPTRLLFTYYEECGGTVRRLEEALTTIHRADAIKLISHYNPLITDAHTDKTMSGDHSLLDSGVDSQSLALHTST